MTIYYIEGEKIMNAEITIQQLGGFGKLQAMVGANNFVQSKEEAWVSFKFKGSKVANYIKIHLNGNDLYDIEFGKIWGHKYKVVEKLDDVYFDSLVELFEKTTGLYLRLF